MSHRRRPGGRARAVAGLAPSRAPDRRRREVETPPPLWSLILIVLLRANRPCGSSEITRAIIEAGHIAPDRERLERAVQAELMADAAQADRALFERRSAGFDQWIVSMEFTDWLARESLKGLIGAEPARKPAAANDD